MSPPDLTELSSANEGLVSHGRWTPGTPLRLHLGCGEVLLPGYINIDFPQSGHNVMSVSPDAYANLLKVKFDANSVDEIRLHHVFEHFNRAVALGMLIRWHAMLKPGGLLVIETPNFAGSAENFLNQPSFKVKMSQIRHLSGDQAAFWAYHLDHWFPERFAHTLSALGFSSLEIQTTRWDHPPHLSNVIVAARKVDQVPEATMLDRAKQLLWDSAIDESERRTWSVWCEQLTNFLTDGTPPHLMSPTDSNSAASSGSPGNSRRPPPPPYNAPDASKIVGPAPKTPVLSREEIHDFNQRARDRWVAEKALSLAPGSTVLDVGAGTCPYAKLFAHCQYKAHDFKKYEGVKLGGQNSYGRIDIESDIGAIPVAEGSFDAILCTEVFEHIPEPIVALEELARITKANGRIFVTAPLGSGLHQQPYHFYGGYTPHWYHYFAPRFGLKILSITPNGGFFKHLAQESLRVSWEIDKAPERLGNQFESMKDLFANQLPELLFPMDELYYVPEFTVGYFVEMEKVK